MSATDRSRASHIPCILLQSADARYEAGRSATIEKLVPAGAHGVAVDIGCGPGVFTKLLAAKGWRVTAVDADADCIEKAKCHAADAHIGDALTVLKGLSPAHCDLAVALEIIEHMPVAQGRELLEAIHRILRPGGALLISTPNRYSPEALGMYHWGEKIRGWRKWDAWNSGHVHIYSSREIVRLVRACGFSVEGITGHWYEGVLPLIGGWRLPLRASASFPFNRLGFNIILTCRKPEVV